MEDHPAPELVSGEHVLRTRLSSNPKRSEPAGHARGVSRPAGEAGAQGRGLCWCRPPALLARARRGCGAPQRSPRSPRSRGGLRRSLLSREEPELGKPHSYLPPARAAAGSPQGN